MIAFLFIPLFLCVFGCAAEPLPSEPQYISGPIVPDDDHERVKPKTAAPTKADVQKQIDDLSRSLSTLQETVDQK